MYGSRSLLIVLAPFVAFALEYPSEKPQVQPASVVAPAAPLKDEGAAPPALKPEALTSEQRGDIFMARKMYREAVEMYRKMPETAVILNKIGIANHQMGDLGIAKRYYERAIKANPKYSEAVNNVGTVYYARKRYGRAVKEYTKALELSPTSASIYSNLGTAHFARKEYKEAFEAYQRALHLDPGIFERQSSGAGQLLQDSSVEERARFHYYLAKVYAQSGMFDKTLVYIRKSLEEGFKERKRYLEEPEFAGLKDNPEFQRLMAQEPRVL
jgi:tetratricopeptide (TPR) repeat protein